MTTKRSSRNPKRSGPAANAKKGLRRRANLLRVLRKTVIEYTQGQTVWLDVWMQRALAIEGGICEKTVDGLINYELERYGIVTTED
jgi:hypothetical protein